MNPLAHAHGSESRAVPTELFTRAASGTLQRRLSALRILALRLHNLEGSATQVLRLVDILLLFDVRRCRVRLFAADA
jgi:hypothetical protein